MELKVLSAGAVKTGVAKLADAYASERGVAVGVEFATAPRLRERVLGGESPDVVIAPPAVLDALAAVSRVVPGTRARVGRARMGVVVHAESAVRDVPDVESLKRTLEDASAVVHNKASSGAYAGKLLAELGLVEALGSRVVVVDSGAGVMEFVALHGPDAVGLAQISEIRVLVAKGLPVRLAAPLPDAVQNVTHYEAAALHEGEHATALARYLATPEARQVFAATGID